MAIQTRSRGPLPSPGPYLAEITNHLDPSYMGRLEVALLKGLPSRVSSQDETYVVSYLSPFYGVTSIRFEGNNSGDFNDVQKSYGFWAVPPDVGTTVMVIFVEGDPNQGYWFGCVQDEFQNHMVPGLAASKMVSMTPEQRKRYGVDMLPVAEFNKSTQKLENPNPAAISRPVHPFADRLAAQGLLADTIRGVTTSGARRDVPSSVFGISTPGPLDPNGKKGKIGYAEVQQMPVSRLGGSSFVMDDGDVNGQNELVRIRTRTGHQILLHNTHDLIYIANSQGTAWIELTSKGKIDIYAQDSISIRTESDFNFRADGDINFESGGSINMASGSNFHIDVSKNYVLNVGENGILTFDGDLGIHAQNDIKMDTSGALHITSTGDTFHQSKSNLHMTSSKSTYQTSGADFNINATGQYKETAKKIDMNGPTATVASLPTLADQATALPTYSLPNRSAGSGWGFGKYFKAEDVVSILKRMPTHEPWDDHESVENPDLKETSVADSDTPKKSGQNTTPPKVTYNAVPNVQGAPPVKTGVEAQDNLAAFLWMIRVCEGTSGVNGYKTMFTGKLFDVDNPLKDDGVTPNPSYQFKDHPRVVNVANGIKSTAAGAYQFLYKTWKECQQTLDLPDFSPSSQDRACLLLLKRRNAYADVVAGNFTSAISKCRLEWASLPGSPYDQNPKKFDYALALYKQGGGTYNA